MAKTTLYGISGSRALRSIWALEETGIDYHLEPVTFKEDSKTPEYLAINPNGRIPALVDGDLTLNESMAINLYLIKKYASALYPQSEADEARALQWSIWGISEIEPLQVAIVVQKMFTPEDKRNPKIIASNERQLARPLKVLDDALAEREYLLGDSFSVADLNVAAVMLLLQLIQFDYSDYANVTRWAKSCYARDALARAQKK